MNHPATMAQVVELALIVKDNLPCKHLILSVEEALINFLQVDTSQDGVLELEPMDPYQRRLLHSLADIFGFAHVSVGEGQDRHLVLERCPETSVPSVLVSDILFLYDGEPQAPSSHQLMRTSHQLLKRAESPSPVLNERSPSLLTFKEREEAYLAARERIFSMDMREVNESEPIKYKPRTVPMVARRMISHALGQKINPRSQDVSANDHEGYREKTEGLNVQVQDEPELSSGMGAHRGKISPPRKSAKSDGNAKNKNHKNGAGATTHGVRHVTQEPVHGNITNACNSQNEASKDGIKKEYLKEEQMVAAKRMFAQALGLKATKAGSHSRCSQTKQDGE